MPRTRQTFDVDMLVLNALQDDMEELPGILEIVRLWRKYWPIDIGKKDVIGALRSLLRKNLIESYVYSPEKHELVVIDPPDLKSAALRGYWYQPTTIGKRLWEEWRASVASDVSFGI